ncbi:hypothetical protein EMPS_05040 [Entomortierella parvispora]|uniref:F-box domain-containing protein n=1 Tax=Entomortierella parvispora TaxID=205924 RepID=A0A9P3LW35_9FUNG|nr:hypothetical protein EMPS_05040 [Entomortierella parvispora]
MLQPVAHRRRLLIDRDRPQRCETVDLFLTIPPEVFLLLVQYLDLNARANCARVSRSWHKAFLPSIYDHVRVSFCDEAVIPSHDILQKHARLIGTLTFENGKGVIDSALPTLYCPHLTTLNIRIQGARGMDNGGLLLQRHQKTVLHVTYGRKASKDLINTLAGCPQLGRLQLSLMPFAGLKDFISFYDQVLSRVRVLVLNSSLTIGEAVEPFELTSGPRAALIQDLNLNDHTYEEVPGMRSAHYWLLEQCPRLVRLQWYCSNTRASLRPLVAALQVANCWDYLEVVALSYSTIDNRDLSNLLRQMVRLTELELRCRLLDQGAWEAIKSFPHHLKTLRVLNLSGCDHLPSSAIQDILATLWGLQVFKANRVSDKAIQEDDERPWVCLGLKELQLQFDLFIPGTTDKILDRISNLMELEHCRFEIFNRVPRKATFVPFSLKLDQGMRTLRTLRKLKKLSVTGCWGESEAWWVREAWPDLEEVWNVHADDRAQWILYKVNFNCSRKR